MRPTTQPDRPDGPGRTVGGAPVRFVMSGLFVTAVTFLLYVGLLTFVPYAAAYSVAFVVGIGIAYAMNRFFVFRSGGGVGSMVLFPLVYVVQYLVGLLVVMVWVDVLGLPEVFASLAAIAVTVPITYLLSRWVFVVRGRSGGQP